MKLWVKRTSIKTEKLFGLSIFLLICTNVFSQENYTQIKKHFFIEDVVMVANTSGCSTSIFNNELSVSYGITNWLSAGIFYDLNKKTFDKPENDFQKDKSLIGLKTSFSVMPLLGEKLNKKLTRWNLSADAYFSYSKEHFTSCNSDKKDHQLWVNYYRISGKFYLTPKFYFAASAGLINTNRFFLGVGIKL
jgi:hypothetical protein